jgi:RNA polymerase sigma-70 factor (ECF subfamily)
MMAGGRSRDADAVVAEAFREHRAVVLAGLIAYVGDFSLAEDALQDAFIDALSGSSRAGVPANLGLAHHRRPAGARSTAAADGIRY